jgi:hypothetical protein
MKKLSYIALASIALFSCDPEFDESVNVNQKDYSAGEADFSSFVTLGNSLTSGFADNALYLHGQENSFPNILAGQFSLVGGGEFTQPLVSDNLGGFTIGGVVEGGNRLVLNSQLSPVPVAGTPTTEITDVQQGPFNNVGVPGAKSYHLTFPGYATLNPYFTRFASSPTATVLEDALANNPTFYSLWIGNNDILGYASTGGSGIDQNETGNLDPSTYAGNDISHVGVVQGSIAAMVQALDATGAKGVICNIPSVTDIPFFTTVPYNAIPMDAATAEATNTAYAQYNGGLLLAQANGFINSEEVAARTINFSAGQNALVIEDETLTDLTAIGLPFLWRQATNQDFIPLTTSGVIGTLADPSNPASVIGVGVPLNDGQILTASEYDNVENAREQYNSIINSIADSYENVIVADMASGLNRLNTSGISYNGGTLYSTFATGGGFSLDGVHPSAQGYAAISNIFIEAVNQGYNANIPTVNIGDYSTIFYE